MFEPCHMTMGCPPNAPRAKWQAVSRVTRRSGLRPRNWAHDPPIRRERRHERNSLLRHDLRPFSSVRDRLLARNLVLLFLFLRFSKTLLCSVFPVYHISLQVLPTLPRGFQSYVFRHCGFSHGVVKKEKHPDEKGQEKQTPATTGTRKRQRKREEKKGMQHEDFPGGHPS